MPYITRAGSRAAQVEVLLDAQHGAAQRGTVTQLILEPRSGEELHCHTGADEATFVLSGQAAALGASGEEVAPAGTLIYSAQGTWHAVRSGQQPVTLLTVHGHGESEGEAKAIPSGQDKPVLVDVAGLGRDPAHNPAMGFLHMSARFLIGESALPSSGLFAGRAAYGDPGQPGGHALHRHPSAEEFLFVLEGEAHHLTEDGELPMRAGDIALIPAGEWHGIWNSGDTPVQALFGYLGVSGRPAAGYELPATASA